MPRKRRLGKQRIGYGAGHISQLTDGHGSKTKGIDFGEHTEHYLVDGWLGLTWYSAEQMQAMREAWAVLRDTVMERYHEKWGPDARPWGYFQFEASQDEIDYLNSVDVPKGANGITMFYRPNNLCPKSAECDRRGDCALTNYCWQADREAAWQVNFGFYHTRYGGAVPATIGPENGSEIEMEVM